MLKTRPHLPKTLSKVKPVKLYLYSVPPYHFGIHSEAFPRQISMNGIYLRKPKKKSILWNFHLPRQGRKGLLFHASSLVHGVPLEFSSEYRAYLLNPQPNAYRLLLFSAPRHQINIEASKLLTTDQKKHKLPSHWPAELVERVIRHHLLKIVVLNTNFLNTTLFQTHHGEEGYFRPRTIAS